MKILCVAILLTTVSCGSFQRPVDQVTTWMRPIGAAINNINVKKVVEQLSELHKPKGVGDFVATRRALGGVIGDDAGHELFDTFVSDRYRMVILDLHRSYTAKAYNNLEKAIDNLGKATSQRKINSHLKEISGLIEKTLAATSHRDTVFQRVVPHNEKATNIRNDINKLIEWQQDKIIPELQGKLLESIKKALSHHSNQTRQAPLLIIGEKLHDKLDDLRFYSIFF